MTSGLSISYICVNRACKALLQVKLQDIACRTLRRKGVAYLCDFTR